MSVPALAPGAALRWDLVRRRLPRDGVRTVLEVGCGGGAFAVRLAQRYDYLGLEPDPTSFALARSRLDAAGRGEVRQASTGSLEPGRRFDLVCAFEVVEHLEDDVAALRAWSALVRPGGHLMLSTPAHPERLGPWDAAVGHYRRYEPRALAGLLRDAGLVDARVEVYGAPLGYLLESARNGVARGRDVLAHVRGVLARVRRVVARARPAPPATSGAQVQAREMAARTGSSGRQLQPSRRTVGTALAVGVAPFRLLQRALPGRGVALLATARRPAENHS